MCNLSEGIYKSGVHDGLSQGLQEGRKQGTHWGRLELLFCLIQKNLLTPGTAASEVHMEQPDFDKEYMEYHSNPENWKIKHQIIV